MAEENVTVMILRGVKRVRSIKINRFRVRFAVLCGSIFALLFVVSVGLNIYQYVYLNYLNGKTSHNHLKFENDYLTTSIKELLKKSKFIDEKYTRLKFCGIGKGQINRYLNKYKFSKVKLVGYEDEYDYVIMTNRVNWKSLNDLKKSETCFQTFNGKVVSQVIRNGLVLSAIKEKQ